MPVIKAHDLKIVLLKNLNRVYEARCAADM
jgi:hypothetical protein